MTDRNRNQSQHNQGQQSSDKTQQTSPPRTDEWEDEGMGSTSRNRSIDRESADDRGRRGRDRDRRSFSGDREHDELGSEMEDNRAVEDRDDMDMDDGLGGPDRSDR